MSALGFLLAHAARARRRALPVRLVALEVVAPDGGAAVEISFCDSPVRGDGGPDLRGAFECEPFLGVSSLDCRGLRPPAFSAEG